MDRLEHKLGMEGLRARVRKVATRQARLAGKENVKSAGKPENKRLSALRQSPLVMLRNQMNLNSSSSVVEETSSQDKCMIPTGKQLPRTPPADSSSPTVPVAMVGVGPSSLPSKAITTTPPSSSTSSPSAPPPSPPVPAVARLLAEKVVQPVVVSDTPHLPLPPPSDLPATPPVAALPPRHCIPTGRQLLSTPLHSARMDTQVEPSGKFELPEQHESLAIPSQQEVEHEKKMVEEMKRKLMEKAQILEEKEKRLKHEQEILEEKEKKLKHEGEVWKQEEMKAMEEKVRNEKLENNVEDLVNTDGNVSNGDLGTQNNVTMQVADRKELKGSDSEAQEQNVATDSTDKHCNKKVVKLSKSGSKRRKSVTEEVADALEEQECSPPKKMKTVTQKKSTCTGISGRSHRFWYAVLPFPF